jgi:predicted MFS family arabinose efflux permease
MGGLLFGAFSVLWSTLALHLQTPPFHLRSGAAGLFGLIGVVGAAAAPAAGRLADRGRGRAVVWAGCGAVVGAFAVFGALGCTILGLVAGVILLDVGVWAAQTANQQRIFATLPEARGRVNVDYLVSYFVGGALGSALGSVAWSRGGWGAVSLAGGALSCGALAAMVRGPRPVPAEAEARAEGA